MDQNYHGVFQKWEVAVAKKVVFEFKKDWNCLRNEDFDDLLQECFIHWLFIKEELNQDGIVSEKSFMAKIIRNKLRDYVKDINRQKRRIRHHCISIYSSQNDDDNPFHLEDKLNSEQCQSKDLVFDLKKTLHKLTDRQRKICRLLEAGLSITEIGSCLNVCRDTVYSEIERIRRIFEQEGLDIYL